MPALLPMEVEREAGPSAAVAVPSSSLPSSSTIPARSAPVQPIPRRDFIHIEYPGVFAAAEGSDRDDSEKRQLHRALQTLSPHPAPYSNVGQSLDHLGRLITLQSKAIECRLGAWTGSPTFEDFAEDGSSDARTTEDLYRHPIVGELVETHDLVAVVRRRVWTRRKKRRRKHGGSGEDAAQEEEGVQISKEYTVDVLGPVKTTARWRKLADYAYEPVQDEGKEDLIDVPASKGTQRGGVLALHDAMAQMDVAALRSFKIPNEKEESAGKAADGKTTTTNASRGIPPPLFTRVDIPFPYGFRQPSMSSLEPYSRRLSDGSTVEGQRWLNASRWKGLAPLQWSLTTGTDPPTGPTAEVAKMESRCDPKILAKLGEVFDSRPVWTRAALINQLPDESTRRTVQFTKEYIPLMSYTVSDGAWRDSLVKLGYDVRQTPDSRFYQKVSFQLPSSTGQKGKGSFKAAYGGAHSSGAGAQTAAKQARASIADGAGSDEANEDAEPEEVDSATNIVPAAQAHKFDGETLNRTTGTFTLCDIVDPVVQPYILAEGPKNLLSYPTAETGWYTGEAFERIKTAVGVRYRHLLEHGTPAKREDVWKAIEGLVMRKVQRERKERGQSQATTVSAAGGTDTGDDEDG